MAALRNGEAQNPLPAFRQVAWRSGSKGPGGRRGHIPGQGSIEADTYNELMAWEPGVQIESRGFGDRPSGKMIEGFDSFVDQTYTDLLAWEPQAPAATTTTRPALDPGVAGRCEYAGGECHRQCSGVGCERSCRHCE